MVDHADCLLAAYDEERNLRSETTHAVNYTESKGIPMMFIHPDTGKITG